MPSYPDYCKTVGNEHSTEYYAGGQCTKCGWRGKVRYSRPMRYPELDSTRHLPNDGRGLLGHRLYATEKRDGSNIQFWLNHVGEVRITSRNGPSECLICGFTSLEGQGKNEHVEITAKCPHCKGRGEILSRYEFLPVETICRCAHVKDVHAGKKGQCGELDCMCQNFGAMVTCLTCNGDKSYINPEFPKGHDRWLPDSCAKDMQNVIREMPEYQAVVAMLHEHPEWNIFCEYIPQGTGPTHIEGHIEKPELVLFDIAVVQEDKVNNEREKAFEFLPYTFIHQMAYHHGLPIVQNFGEGQFTSMEDYWKFVNQLFEICKERNREGVVIKCYEFIDQYFDGKDGRSHHKRGQVYVKEKLDTPKAPPVVMINTGQPILPILPESECRGSILKVEADNGLDFMLNKSKAMPAIIKQMNEECRKHECRMPHNPFIFYQEYLRTREQKSLYTSALSTPSEKGF